MLGKNVKSYPDAVKQMLKDGNELGNHSYDHQQLTKIDAEANAKSGDDCVISAADSKVKVAVIPTNEELGYLPRDRCSGIIVGVRNNSYTSMSGKSPQL